MWAKQASHFHAGAWLLWLVAAMLAALSTRNPLYLSLIMCVAISLNLRLGKGERQSGDQTTGQYLVADPARQDPARQAKGLLLKTVIGLVVAVALLKGMSLHIGATVLFKLPEEWPVIGGPITLEAMASAGLDALQILTILAVFSAFSTGADYYAILRSVPSFMHQVGLITSIAITFVPQTVTRFAEIREAQALRGHKVRRPGDLLPLIMPLMSGGMERSMNLAEAMEARGFSRHTAGAPGIEPIPAQIGLAAGLGLILIGGASLAFYSDTPWAGQAIIAAGAGLLLVTLRAMGRGVKRSRYRKSIWRDRDTLVTACAIGIIAFLVTYRLFAPSALVYSPFGLFLRIHLPEFDPVVALALLGLAIPIRGCRGAPLTGRGVSPSGG